MAAYKPKSPKTKSQFPGRLLGVSAPGSLNFQNMLMQPFQQAMLGGPQQAHPQKSLYGGPPQAGMMGSLLPGLGYPMFGGNGGGHVRMHRREVLGGQSHFGPPGGQQGITPLGFGVQKYPPLMTGSFQGPGSGGG